jgi:hypothetical protein
VLSRSNPMTMAKPATAKDRNKPIRYFIWCQKNGTCCCLSVGVFLLHLMQTQLLFAIRRGAKSQHVAVPRNQQRPPLP